MAWPVARWRIGRENGGVKICSIAGINRESLWLIKSDNAMAASLAAASEVMTAGSLLAVSQPISATESQLVAIKAVIRRKCNQYYTTEARNGENAA
jgi:hypothetical protein